MTTYLIVLPDGGVAQQLVEEHCTLLCVITMYS